MNERAVIVGGGRVGRHTAEQLIEHGYSVTIVERDAEKVEALSSRRVGTVVEGDGTDRETLREAGAAEANIVAALTDDTSANVIVCGLARELSPEVETLARVAEDGEQQYQYLSDVDSVVYPAAAGADVTVDRILRD
ncbi:potassium channel family protein [Halomarina ordinaria]|uniref:Potassium channel family protein n=1 Tax=Halomarina ordinaria TaxID=3033939 RepID=A0ABD5UBA9_9EURY|nr:TrkA family potassium uptake protein [Halomarina sp. PSRA2]